MDLKHEPPRRERFFVVEDRGKYSVMSEEEVEADEGVTLRSGTCYSRAEAEAELRKGLQDGTY